MLPNRNSLTCFLLSAFIASNSWAIPYSTSSGAFPDLREELTCSPLFYGSEQTTVIGRIACSRDGDLTACVVGAYEGAGVAASRKLARQEKLSSETKDTFGALVVYADRGVIGGTTRGASRAQQYTLQGRQYKNTDGVVIPASEQGEGRFAKGTLVVKVNATGRRYLVQDANFIAGRDASGGNSFYSIVTPGGEVGVVTYINGESIVQLKCHDIPESLIGDFLTAPGLAFINQ